MTAGRPIWDWSHADWTSPGRTSVLLAVLAEARPTVRGVADRSGLALTTTYRHLQQLERAGFVAWGGGGRLRPLVRLIPLEGPQ